MTYEMMVDTLTSYCNMYRECDNCELKNLYDNDVNNFINRCGCAFVCMNEQMVKKIYNWYKELDPATCENVEAKCCDKELDVTNLHIEPKVAQHYAICQKLNSIYKAKNHDYGDSFGDTYKKLGIISAVTRLSDKMNRLMSLAVKHDAQVKDEKIEDTLLDMANYAIMTLIELGYEVDE